VNKTLAWHFLPEDRKLRWGTEEEVVPGQKLIVKPPLHMCRHGLHAGIRAIDALTYAPGPVVCRVELGGEILEDEDKCCATERTCVWLADASEVLHRFACWCAERVLMRERQAGREPDPRSWAAVQAKRDWLEGGMTREELETAKSTAWEVDLGTDWSTAQCAAWSDAWSATRNVAWSAAWSTARSAQNEELTRVLLLLEGGA